MFLATRDKWEKLATYLETQEVFGWDTEFEGVDFKDGLSCVNRAKIDLWSIAVFDGGFSPRGFNTAKGYVLPPEAVPTFKNVLENPDIKKPAHNSNVDAHCMYNVGVDVQGIVNTLTLARWLIPDRFTYGLDTLGEDYLGRGKTAKFQELFSEDIFETVNKPKPTRVCSCGVPKCMKRIGHEKHVELIDNFVDKKIGTRIIPLHTVRPGHRLWEKYVDYAKVDAVIALELYDFFSTIDWNTEVCWYPNGGVREPNLLGLQSR